MTTNPDKEELRQELMQWQGRRFTVLATVLVIVPTIIGWLVASPAAFSWEIGALFPLLILMCGCQLTWLFSVFTVLIGTYLESQGISEWERRSRIIRELYRIPSVNSSLSVLYLVLGAVSIAVPAIRCEKSPTLAGIVLFSIVALLFVAALVNMAFRSYPRSETLTKWQAVERKIQAEQ
jgi:hypothetical protein